MHKGGWLCCDGVMQSGEWASNLPFLRFSTEPSCFLSAREAQEPTLDGLQVTSSAPHGARNYANAPISKEKVEYDGLQW